MVDKKFKGNGEPQISSCTLYQAIDQKICAWCGASVLVWSTTDPIGPDWNFRDECSRREYKISGLCQECQDKVFGDFEEQDEF